MGDVLEVPARVEGQVAHDDPFVGNPLVVGGRYVATPVNVADGDAVTWRLSAAGAGIVVAEGLLARDDPISAIAPLIAGARAGLDEPSAVSADGDVVDLWADRLGRQVIIEGHPNPVSPVVVNATASGDTQVIAAPGAGSLYIQRVWLSNNAAAKIKAALREGAAGTIRARGTLAADGGGVMLIFTPWWKLAAVTALTVNLAAAGDVEVNVLDHFIAA